MKKKIALICAVMLIAAVCGGCSGFGGGKTSSSQPSSSAAETQAPPATQAPEATVAPTTPATAAPETQAPADSSIGELSEYVRTAKESGNLRLPEILLDSDDAAAANAEIMAQYGAYVDDPESHNYVGALDYEAYLNQNVLSVLITGKLDGGNSFGQCYTFDVTTGKELSNEELCSLTGRDHSAASSTLKTNLTSYYDEKYSNLPANDELRNQTLSDQNVGASKMYLDGSDKLMALVQTFAAVGGGKWVATIPAE